MKKGVLIFAGGLLMGIGATKGTEILLANPKVQELIDNAKKKFKKEEPTPEQTESIMNLEVSMEDISNRAKELLVKASETVEEVVDTSKDIVSEVVETKPAPKKRGRKKKYSIPPYEITQAQFSSVEPAFEKVIFWYDNETEAFTKNDGSVMDYSEAARLFGAENLDNYISDDTKRFLYIRNETELTDFEIIKE